MLRRIVALVAACTVAAATAQTAEELISPPAGQWPTAGLSTSNQRFSPLDQIDRGNVGSLRIVWSRDLGFDGIAQSSPVVWDGRMYLNGVGSVIALDAANGDLLWEYRPEIAEATPGFIASRMRGGVTVYDGKVFYNRNDAITVALDAVTGEEVWSTTNGDASLGEGFTTGPLFADGKLVAGVTGADFGGAPGRIVAMNIEDGELLWTFNTVPTPDDPAFATWQPTPPSWEAGVGGASPWSSGVYDPDSRTVIWGTGQPTPWDRIDDRRGDHDGDPSADLYSASFVGVDIDTGELKWYHQVVPADEWDYDQLGVPMVTEIEMDGAMRTVALLPTTTGFLVVLDPLGQEFFLSQFEREAFDVPAVGFPHPVTQTRDFLARLRQAGPASSLAPRVALWDPALREEGAAELNERFAARSGEPMDPVGWAAYAAVTILHDAVVATGATDAGTLVAYLTAPGTTFRLHKRAEVSFRAWDHQLRQPLYLVAIDPEAPWGPQVSRRIALAEPVGALPDLLESDTASNDPLDLLGTPRGASSCTL